MPTSVVLENNTFAQACKVHCVKCPCTGAYSGAVQTPGQSKLKVGGQRVVLGQQVHTYGCPDCSSDRVITNVSSKLKVGGVPVALMGPVTGAHGNGPMAGSSCKLKA